jgi:hypothetical protein
MDGSTNGYLQNLIKEYEKSQNITQNTLNSSAKVPSQPSSQIEKRKVSKSGGKMTNNTSVNLGNPQKNSRGFSGKQRGDSYSQSYELKMRNDSRGKYKQVSS